MNNISILTLQTFPVPLLDFSYKQIEISVSIYKTDH